MRNTYVSTADEARGAGAKTSDSGHDGLTDVSLLTLLLRLVPDNHRISDAYLNILNYPRIHTIDTAEASLLGNVSSLKNAESQTFIS